MYSAVAFRLRGYAFNFKQRTTVVERHCEPTGRANARPMTGSAKQSIVTANQKLDCFVASAFAR
jgi:hypothetical protein